MGVGVRVIFKSGGEVRIAVEKRLELGKRRGDWSWSWLGEEGRRGGDSVVTENVVVAEGQKGDGGEERRDWRRKREKRKERPPVSR